MKTAAWILGVLGLLVLTVTGYGRAQAPVPISPGAADGQGLVISSCPTFSWAEVTEATGYKLEVFAHDAAESPLFYEDIAATQTPVLVHDIPVRALTWTPSADQGLCAGTYAWYVAAVQWGEVLEWSEGRVFAVNALAGLDAASGNCVGLPSDTTATDNDKAQSEEMVIESGDANGALSLEQVISIKVAQEQSAKSEINNAETAEIPLPGPITMGTEGSRNTFYGQGAGSSILGDYDATFIGANAGTANTTGDDNTFVGRDAGYSNTTANFNTFLGTWAGYSNTSGDENTFVGQDAGFSNTTGFYNTFVGRRAGYSNTTGSWNIFLGHNAGYSNTTGSDNTFLGWEAGSANTTGIENTFVGRRAGVSNTTGYYNTFLGMNAGFSNTEGYENTTLGYDAGLNNTTGNYNTFLGTWAGVSNTTGIENTFVGHNAGYSNTAGNSNVFIGYRAGYNELGSDKLYIDNSDTGNPLIYGEFNNNRLVINGSLGVGKTPSAALDVNGTATASAFVGDGSGLTNISFTEVDPQVGDVTLDRWCVGNGSAVQCTEELPDPSPINELQTLSLVDSTLSISGGNSVNIAGGQADNLGNHTATQTLNLNGHWISGDGDGEGLYVEATGNIVASGVFTVGMTVSPSDERFKKDIRPIEAPLQKVMEIDGVSYNWRSDEYKERGFSDRSQIGLIAQDVEETFPELVHTDANGYKAVAYSKMVAVLVEAVKELKTENEALKSQNNEIKEITKDQQSQINELRALIKEKKGLSRNKR